MQKTVSDIAEATQNVGATATKRGLVGLIAGAAFDLHGLFTLAADVTGIGAITWMTGFGLSKVLQMGKGTPALKAA